MLALLLAVHLADAPVEPVTTPKGTPPRIAQATIKDGQLQLTETFCRLRYTAIEREVVKDGKLVKVVDTTAEIGHVTMSYRKDLSKATFSTVSGKKLTRAEAEKRLAKPAVLLVSGDGKPVDASYLAMFKSDALVLVAPIAISDHKEAPAPKELRPGIPTVGAKDGILNVTETLYELQTFKVKETIEQDGMKVEVEKPVTQPVPVAVKGMINLKQVTITTAGGKKLTQAEGEKRLAKPAGLILSNDGKAVGESYLALLQSGILVVVPEAPPPAPKE